MEAGMVRLVGITPQATSSATTPIAVRLRRTAIGRSNVFVLLVLVIVVHRWPVPLGSLRRPDRPTGSSDGFRAGPEAAAIVPFAWAACDWRSPARGQSSRLPAPAGNTATPASRPARRPVAR